ncbi:hypothetical protein [Corynebacterium renale]|uniref:hypothetical protein n=1 Tax=Corynebacterium renale TaxID=1724 RepID=UPI0013792476|nr:hypothetical protein [Corynebacterium renale]
MVGALTPTAVVSLLWIAWLVAIVIAMGPWTSATRPQRVISAGTGLVTACALWSWALEYFHEAVVSAMPWLLGAAFVTQVLLRQSRS